MAETNPFKTPAVDVDVDDVAPPPGPPPPEVPEGWIARWDDNYKQFFYVNLATKKPQWEMPTESAKGMRRCSHSVLAEVSDGLGKTLPLHTSPRRPNLPARVKDRLSPTTKRVPPGCSRAHRRRLTIKSPSPEARLEAARVPAWVLRSQTL